MKNTLILFLAMVSSPPLLSGAGGPLVSFLSVRENPDGLFTYSYSVRNESAEELVYLTIGEDGCDSAEFELKTPPAGPATSGNRSPSGWKIGTQTMKKSDFVSVRWQADNPRSAMGPGVHWEMFAVVVPSKDAAYESAHWTLGLKDGDAFSGALGELGRLAQWKNGRKVCEQVDSPS